MANQKYIANNMEYTFNADSFRGLITEQTSNRLKYKSKAELIRKICEKYNFDVETVKKWIQGKSTPSDISKVKDLALFFEVDIENLLTRKEEEIKVNKTEQEIIAIRRILRSYLDLLHTFCAEKENIYYGCIKPQMEMKPAEYIIPEGISVETSEWEEDHYSSKRLKEAKDRLYSELIVSAIDLPQEIINKIRYLGLEISCDEFDHMDFTRKEDVMDLVEEMGEDVVDYINAESIRDISREYYDKLMDVLKPYNLELEQYRSMV